MSDIFYLRPIDPPVFSEDLAGMLESAGGCLDMHRVYWKKSFLAEGGQQLLCWYQAPDAESARIALRTLGSDMNAIWPGDLVDLPHMEDPDLDSCNIFLRLSIEGSPSADSMWNSISQLVENTNDIDLLQGINLVGAQSLICLLKAAEPASVKAVFEDCGLSPTEWWPCKPIGPKY